VAAEEAITGIMILVHQKRLLVSTTVVCYLFNTLFFSFFFSDFVQL